MNLVFQKKIMLNLTDPRKPAGTKSCSCGDEERADRISPLPCSLSEPSILSATQKSCASNTRASWIFIETFVRDAGIYEQIKLWGDNVVNSKDTGRRGVRSQED